MGHSQNIALLKARLQVPVIVHDIIAGADRMDDETCYGLHAAIGDLKPHEALLAITLSTRTLLAYCDQNDPFTQSLKNEIERMIQDHSKNFDGNENDILESMDSISADLNILHMRLKSLADILHGTNTLAGIFCDIFSTQASAQKVVAEEFAELHEIMPAAAIGTGKSRPARPILPH